jgi:5'-deoxynucleotidase YfbR-like HD superfamily hydrolase
MPLSKLFRKRYTMDVPFTPHDIHKLTGLESYLRALFTSLEAEKRWKPMIPLGVTEEHVLAHSMKMAVIVRLMNTIEEYCGNPHNLPFYELLWCAISHDFGEATCGDTDIFTKTPEHEKKECDAFAQIAEDITPEALRNLLLPQPFDRQKDTPEMVRLYWDAAEKIGYVLFANAEMQRPNISKTLLDRCRLVGTHHERTLSNAAQHFKSVRALLPVLYPPEHT